MIYALLIALARYPFYVMRPRTYGRAWRVRPRTAWVVTCAVTWLAALIVSTWPLRDTVFFALVLAAPVLFTAVTVAIATTGWPYASRASAWALAGYVVGVVARAVFPAPCVALDVALPAIYAATGAVLACWTGYRFDPRFVTPHM